MHVTLKSDDRQYECFSPQWHSYTQAAAVTPQKIVTVCHESRRMDVAECGLPSAGHQDCVQSLNQRVHAQGSGLQ